MKSVNCALILAFTINVAHSDPIIVVPGSNAGYLYFPAVAAAGTPAPENEEEPKQTITFSKMGSFTEYTVTADPGALNCDSSCGGADFEVPLGSTVTVTLNGNWTMGSAQISLLGDWVLDRSWTVSESQANSSTLTFSVPATSLGAMNVSLTVAATPLPGTEIGEVGGVPAIYMGTVDGQPVIAAHRSLGSRLCMHISGSTSKEEECGQKIETVLGASHTTFGSANMPSLPSDSPAANHCRILGDNQWYLPASTEMALVGGLSNDQFTNIFGGSFKKIKIWSSTERLESNGTKAEKMIAAEWESGKTINTNKDEGKHKRGKTDEPNFVLCMRRFS